MSDLFLDEIVRPEEPPHGDRSVRRADRDARDQKRRRRRRRNVIALVLSLAILGGIAYAVVKYVLPMISDIGASLETESAEDFAGPGTGTTEVVVPPGATGADIGVVLYDAGVVASVEAFTAAYTADPSAAGIQPGTYRLLLEMKASDTIRALLDASSRVTTRVTIPEGLQVNQILEKLSSVTTVPVAEYQAAMADTTATGLPAEAGGNYEGWLFAATYTFEPGTTPAETIATMVAQTVAVLDERGVAVDDRMRVLTMASLVEREARTPEDRAKVARAIQNRLDIDMKLDIDASVAYGAGISGQALTTDIIDTDTPYNLYIHTGLPPTPIAAPSTVAIDAVLAPADGPWLFWVTINLDTGETLFAESFTEHQNNVQLLRAWQAEQE